MSKSYMYYESELKRLGANWISGGAAIGRLLKQAQSDLCVTDYERLLSNLAAIGFTSGFVKVALSVADGKLPESVMGSGIPPVIALKIAENYPDVITKIANNASFDVMTPNGVVAKPWGDLKRAEVKQLFVITPGAKNLGELIPPLEQEIKIQEKPNKVTVVMTQAEFRPKEDKSGGSLIFTKGDLVVEISMADLAAKLHNKQALKPAMHALLDRCKALGMNVS